MSKSTYGFYSQCWGSTIKPLTLFNSVAALPYKEDNKLRTLTKIQVCKYPSKYATNESSSISLHHVLLSA